MGALNGAADLLGQQLPMMLGLLIPFAGIIIPSIVIFAISSPARRHPAATSPHGMALHAAGAGASSPVAVAAAAVAPAVRPVANAAAEISWLCERLRESDIFEGLTDHELRLVAGLGERRQVAAGERLAHAGSRGETLFLILKGEIRLLTQAQGEIPVRMAHPGETIPLAALVDPPVLVTTIEAITEGEVFAIPRMRLLDLFDIQPMIGLQVYRAMSRGFERRYRKTLDGLVGTLKVAMQPSKAETRTPQLQE